jgi:hypothetical protein
MKNKKKTAVTITAIGVSAAIFAASAVAASGNLSAYNAFKDSIFGSFEKSSGFYEQQNHTFNATFKLDRDGQPFAQMLSVMKVESNDTSSSTSSITFNGKTHTSENWHYVEPADDGGEYRVNIYREGEEDVYNVSRFYSSAKELSEMQSYRTDYHDNKASSAEMKFASALVDTLIGDCKNYFSYDGDYIVANLSGTQIPELAQLGFAAGMSSMKDEYSDGSRNYHGASMENEVEEQFMKELVNLQELRLDSMSGRMKPDGQSLDMMTGSMQVAFSGTDSSGTRHNYQVDFSLESSNAGSTTIDKIDLNGKKQEVTEYNGTSEPTTTRIDEQGNKTVIEQSERDVETSIAAPTTPAATDAPTENTENNVVTPGSEGRDDVDRSAA